MVKVGIAGYGASIPRFRIKVSEIARVWGKDGAKASEGLCVKEKAVASMDEDSASLAVEAARNAFESSGCNPKDLGAIYVGSESKPYAVKPTASIVAEALDATPHLMAADLEFACKAGTAGVQACMGLVASGMVKLGLAIGSDTAQGRPADALEYSAGSGAAAPPQTADAKKPAPKGGDDLGDIGEEIKEVEKEEEELEDVADEEFVDEEE